MKGLVYVGPWGSLRHAINSGFRCLQAADLGVADADAKRAFAKEQLDYALGSTGRSFVVGFGLNPPERPHHRAASCEAPPTPCNFDDLYKPGPNPHIHYGALVGGPDDQDVYADERPNAINNEVALDYNAGYQSVMASLIAFQEQNML